MTKQYGSAMPLIDTHCHLSFSAFKHDVDQVIQRALKAGVWMITLGVDYETSRRAVELAKKYEGVYAAIGQHPVGVGPGAVEHFDKQKYQELLDSTSKVVAVGEMGLDYSRLPEGKEKATKKLQQRVFCQQIRWAQENNLPIAVHNRDTHEDCLNLLQQAAEAVRGQTPHGGIRGVAHFFTGTKEQASKYFELGFLVSLTGVTTLTSQFDDLVRALPLERIMIETDSPYAAPAKHRSQRNEPAYAAEVAQKIAKLKGLLISEVARATTQNAKILFSI